MHTTSKPADEEVHANDHHHVEKFVDPHSTETLLRNEPQNDDGHGTVAMDIVIH